MQLQIHAQPLQVFIIFPKYHYETFYNISQRNEDNLPCLTFRSKQKHQFLMVTNLRVTSHFTVSKS